MQEFSYRQMEDGNYCVTGYQGDEAEVTIPASYNEIPVTVLFDQLFSGHTEITSVHIPDTVTDLGEFLFDGCVNLRHLDLPASLTTLWGYTFARCGLEEIILPDQLTSLPPFAFRHEENIRLGIRRLRPAEGTGFRSQRPDQPGSVPDESAEYLISKTGPPQNMVFVKTGHITS